MINWNSIANILLVLMFLYSGFNKTFSGGKKEMKKLTRLGLSNNLAQGLNFAAGVFEIVASLIVILSVVTTKISLQCRNNALRLLIAFTVLVTLLFKIFPQPAKLLGLTANLSLIGGLIISLNNQPE